LVLVLVRVVWTDERTFGVATAMHGHVGTCKTVA